MRYLRRFIENKRFDDRDYTNYRIINLNGYQWSLDPEYRIDQDKEDAYIKINDIFNIDYDDLGYILIDFLEHFDLAYRCKYDKKEGLIQIEFFPNVNLEKLLDDDFSFIKWFYNKLSDEKSDSEYLVFLEEIDGRLSEYDLTLRNNLPKEYRKGKEDFPYDFFGGDKYLQLWIGKI